jgi:hypothetical protein
MSTDKTISEITRLQHFLFDVWDWQELHQIGRQLHVASMVHEPGDPDLFDHSRSADAQLTEHLSLRYARAANEIDRTIGFLPASDLLEALLEQLHAQLVRLSNIEVSYREWYDRTAHPDILDFERASDGSVRSEAQTRQAERDHHSLQREAWRCVADELSFFLTKLAAKVQRLRNASLAQTDNHRQPTHRLHWRSSTAAYVHVAKELLLKGYVELPGLNGKEGDGNVTELFRRLSQAFVVHGRSGEELQPDELQRRFNGRPIATAKAARLDLPEAKDM